MKRASRALDKEGRGSEMDFFPKTYILPSDFGLFREEFNRNAGGVWIMKPCGRAQGRGIFMVDKLSQVRVGVASRSTLVCEVSYENGLSALPSVQSVLVLCQVEKWRQENASREQDKQETFVVSRYLENPLLVGGRKFDLRIYALVLSYMPLKVYLYRYLKTYTAHGTCRCACSLIISRRLKKISLLTSLHRGGFCRFTAARYTMDRDDMKNLYVHLTNVAIQKRGENYDRSVRCLAWSVHLSIMATCSLRLSDEEDVCTFSEALA